MIVVYMFFVYSSGSLIVVYTFCVQLRQCDSGVYVLCTAQAM